MNTYLINNGIDVYKNESDRLKKAGNIEGYNGRPSVSYWTNEYTNMINETDSTIWHEGATTYYCFVFTFSCAHLEPFVYSLLWLDEVSVIVK